MSDNATIGRAPRNKEHPYVQIARETLQDGGISFEAAGMLSELLSRPDNWKVKVSQLRHRGDGKTRVYRILNELIKATYIRRVDGRNERGHLTTHYLVYETKADAKADQPVSKTETGSGLPDTDNPDTGFEDTTYKRDVVIRESKELPVDANASTSGDPANASLQKQTAPKSKAKPKAVTPKDNPPTDPAAAALNAGIVSLIEAWHKTTGTFSPNPYGNKTFRAAAGMMHEAGITSADVRDFCWWHQKVDAFWKGKPLSFMKVADGYQAWRSVNQNYHAPTEGDLKQAEEDRRAMAEVNRVVSEGVPMSAAETIASLGLGDLFKKMTGGKP